MMLAFNQLLAQAKQLSADEKIQFAESLLASLREDLNDPTPPQPKKSLLGVLAPYGNAPSAEDIDEVRAEIWANFPREDI